MKKRSLQGDGGPSRLAGLFILPPDAPFWKRSATRGRRSWDGRQCRRRRNGRERMAGGSEAGAEGTLLKSLCGRAGELRGVQGTAAVKDGSGSEGRSAQRRLKAKPRSSCRPQRIRLFHQTDRLGFGSTQSQLWSSSESHPADEAQRDTSPATGCRSISRVDSIARL